MPNIREYTSPIDKLQPSEIGSAALAQAARRIGALGSEEGQAQRELGTAIGRSFKAIGETTKDVLDTIEKHDAQQEISMGAAGITNLHDEINKEWADTAKSSDPNDPNVAKNFRDSLEDRYQKFADSFRTDAGRRWAIQEIGSLRQHVFEKTAADQATMAGDALITNIGIVKNRASSVVRDDPTSLDAMLGTVDRATDAFIANSPTVTPAETAKAHQEVATHVKTDIVHSAIIGMAEKNPDLARKMVDSGKYSDYIDGAKAHDVINTIDRAKREDARWAEYQQKQKIADASQKATDQYLSDMTTPDGKVQVPPGMAAKVLSDTKLLPSARLELYRFQQSMLEHQEKDVPVVTDPKVRTDLIARMGAEPGSPGAYTPFELYKLHAEGKLSEKDLMTFKDAQQANVDDPVHRGPILSSALAAAKSDLTYTLPGLPGKDPKGEALYADFIGHFLPSYNLALRTGNLQPNALDLRDPKSMISLALSQFKRTASQKLQDRLEELQSLGGNEKFVPPKEWLVRPATGKTPLMYYDMTAKKYFDENGKETKP